MKTFLFFALSVTALGAAAQGSDQNYPKAAISFLDIELPQMEAAVAGKDRSYFAKGNIRVQRFLEAWGLKTNPSVLEAYPMCTDAVTDYQIVGLCRILPPGTICDPTTFIPKFERNLALCREASGDGPSPRPSGAGK